MAISAKSVDEVRSWFTDNGLAADTFEYTQVNFTVSGSQQRSTAFA